MGENNKRVSALQNHVMAKSHASMDRRKFMQGCASMSLVATGAGLSPPLLWAKPVEGAASNIAGKVVWSSCTVNCGSRCALRMHVVDDKIAYVETDNTGKDIYGDHQVRACLRGRTMRHRIYNPDRLKTPLKRVGKRGEGKFEAISWDEAYDIIVNNLKRVIKDYGNESVYLQYGTGTLGGTVTKSWPPGGTLIARLMNLCGGYLNHYGDYSSAQIAAGLNYTYGGWAVNNSVSDIVNSKLVVYFGNNPMETRMSGAGVTYHLTEALARSKARMIVIDPRYTETASGREDEWIAIRPGTDSALVSAIAYVLITENMVDQAFLDKYCVGYDEKTLPASAPKNGHYKAYILGKGDDGVAKTPEWAAPITGVPAEKIISLAKEIGQAKPCYIAQGWGPQRHLNGELNCRAISMLSLLTGNVGLPGGGTGAREGSYSIPFVRFPTLTNPVKTTIPFFLWTDAVYRAKEMTAKRDGIKGKEKLDVPIKFIWNYAGNCMINQHADINRTHEILQDDKLCEMIVVIDNHMTSSAQYADIVLPDLTIAEQDDFCMDASAGNMNYVIFAQQAIPPQFECRSVYQMCTDLAERMGVKDQFTEGRTQREWLEHLHALSKERHPQLPDFETFKQNGIYKEKDPNGHFVAYKAFRENPEANPLKTPSGKIEIYSETLAQISAEWELDKGDVIHPLPVHVSTQEGWDDLEGKKKYPLQMTGFHHKSRTHSTYGSVELLKRAAPQEVWINPIDAESRGIKNGDRVHIFNDRGDIHIAAKVTPRIIPGAVAEGAWYQPDSQRVDQGGNINVLTTLKPSPLAKGNPQHTNLVEIKKV